MTEWPQTWKLAASFPDLVTILTAGNPAKAMKREGSSLPGSVQATANPLEPIRVDADLMALITGKGPNVSDSALEADVVRKRAQLTPLRTRMRRLGDAQCGALGHDRRRATHGCTVSMRPSLAAVSTGCMTAPARSRSETACRSRRWSHEQ